MFRILIARLAAVSDPPEAVIPIPDEMSGDEYPNDRAQIMATIPNENGEYQRR